MSHKSLRIASIANQLLLEDRQRIAIKWFDIKRNKNILSDFVPKLSNYLQDSEKIEFIKSKLNLVSSIDSLVKAMNELKDNLKNISERDITSQRDMTPKINWINKITSALENMKNLINKEDQKVLAIQIAQTLMRRSYTGFIASGTTEPLEEDSDDSIEDGITSHPLENHKEE